MTLKKPSNALSHKRQLQISYSNSQVHPGPSGRLHGLSLWLACTPYEPALFPLPTGQKETLKIDEKEVEKAETLFDKF